MRPPLSSPGHDDMHAKTNKPYSLHSTWQKTTTDGTCRQHASHNVASRNKRKDEATVKKLEYQPNSKDKDKPWHVKKNQNGKMAENKDPV